MTAELYGFTLLLRLKPFMTNDYDPIFDVLLAWVPVTDDEISKVFRSEPTAKRVRANGQFYTKQQWRERDVKKEWTQSLQRDINQP